MNTSFLLALICLNPGVIGPERSIDRAFVARLRRKRVLCASEGVVLVAALAHRAPWNVPLPGRDRRAIAAVVDRVAWGALGSEGAYAANVRAVARRLDPSAIDGGDLMLAVSLVCAAWDAKLDLYQRTSVSLGRLACLDRSAVLRAGGLWPAGHSRYVSHNWPWRLGRGFRLGEGELRYVGGAVDDPLGLFFSIWHRPENPDEAKHYILE